MMVHVTVERESSLLKSLGGATSYVDELMGTRRPCTIYRFDQYSYYEQERWMTVVHYV